MDELNSNKRSTLWLAVLTLATVYLVVTAWNLRIQTIANPDEPRYAAAARTMLRGQTWQDWLVPFFNAQPRLVKPIFFYWLIAATGKAGESLGLGLVTGFRLGPLLMGLLAVIGTCLLGARLRSARMGFVAAAVLMTCAEVHKVARELVVDMTLTAFIVWAWVFCHVALERIKNPVTVQWGEADEHGRARTNTDQHGLNSPCRGEAERLQNPKSKIQNPKSFLPLLGFYMCLGFACMTKGPFLVAMFVVVPLLVYLSWCGRLKDLKHAGLWWGMPISLVLGLWWSFALYKLGYDWRSFFVTENLQRAVGAKDHTSHPWPYLFYLRTLGENFSPWVVVLPFAAWWAVKQHFRFSIFDFRLSHLGRQEAEGPGGEQIENRKSKIADQRFLLCALFVPFFFLGLSVSKRPLYLLPLYPYISLALAWVWDEALLTREGEPVKRAGLAGMWAFSLAVVAAGVWCARFWLPQQGGSPLEAMALIGFSATLAVCGVAAARKMQRGRRYRASLWLLAMGALFCVGFETVWRPMNERMANRQEFYREVDEALKGRPLVMLGHTSNEAVWYLDRQGERIDNLNFPGLKERFFGASRTRLLASVKDLAKKPALKKAIKTAPVKAMRLREEYVLAEPDPAHPPSPEVFRPVSEREDKGGED